MLGQSSLDKNILQINSNIKSRNYWNTRLQGFELNEYLSGVAARNLTQFDDRGSCRHTMSSVLVDKLHLVGPSDKAKHVVLLASLAMMIKKCSFLDDIVLFTPPYKDSQQPFVGSVVPIRINNFRDVSFPQFVHLLKDILMQDFQYADYPLHRILHVEQEDLYSLPIIGMILHSVQDQEPLRACRPALSFNFSVDDSAVLTVDFDGSRYQEKFVMYLADLYLQLLERLLSETEKCIEEISLMGDDEIRLRLLSLDRSAVAFPSNCTIVDLFDECVQRMPHKVALTFYDQQFTYREIDQAATKVACYLHMQHGVGTDNIVALLVDKVPETIIGMLGILKAGGAYLPIDIDYPKQRIAYMIDNSGAVLLLTKKKWLNQAQYPLTTLFFEDIEEMPVREFSVKPVIRNTDLCYVIYTSGTTGNPKGVMLEHQNVVRLLFNDAFQFQVYETDVWTMFHNHCFDMSVWEMYGALLRGGRLVLVPKAIARDPQLYLQLLRKEGVTMLSQTPTAFYRISEEELLADQAELKLRYIVFAGEALSPGRLSGWRCRYPQTVLVNMYGITETTVHNTYKEITEAEIEQDISNIGKPIPTLSFYVLDADRNHMPDGIIGELFVGGAGLARGYVNNEVLTAERFINHPKIQGQRLYKSGDLVRMLPSGDLEYMGRIDTQIQIRGFRVELGEIQYQLCQHHAITNCVILDKDEGTDKQLVAYYVAENPLKTADLRHFLLERLPDYMVPAQWMHLKELPVTANGKLDRKYLRELVPTVDNEYVAPKTGMEKRLGAIWARVLRIEQVVGVETSFFILGGNSLTVVRLAGMILKDFGVQLSVSMLFKEDTIRKQITAIGKGNPHAYKDIVPAPHKRYYPLSPAQKRLYFLHYADGATTAYNMPVALYLRGDVDKILLEQAFRRIITRHGILRTRFLLENNTPVQEILPDIDFSIEYFESTSHGLPQIVSRFRKPFVLNEAPLFRVGLIRIDMSTFVLIFDIHHIISDGVSQNLILKEVIQCYTPDQSLPEVPLQYIDYTVWLQTTAQQKVMVQQQKYWLTEFNTLPEPLELPMDYHRPVQKSYAGDTYTFELGESKFASLRKIAHDRGASMYMLMLALYQVLLAKLSGRSDVVVGTILAGRHHADLENMIGIFTNTIAMRSQPLTHLSLVQFIDHVKEKALQNFDHQDYQYEELLRQLHLNRSTGRNALFDVFFAYQNITPEQLILPGIKVDTYHATYQLSKFDLTLTIYEKEDHLAMEFEYSTDLFLGKTIRKFTDAFMRIIDSVIDQPEITIGDIEIVMPQERGHLLSVLNFSQVPFPRGRSIIEVFEEQVEKYPQAISVTYGDEHITYQELNQRANWVGQRLISKGITPGKIVGLFLERSIDMIVAILGVLKSGGAYLPIDITSPEKRINTMLDDCHASLVIVSNILLEKCITPLEKLSIQDIASEERDLPNPRVFLPADSSCYIIYTSGTTGKPKGVMVTHDNLMSLFFNNQFLFDFNQSDVWTMFHRYCFDFSVWEMYGALLFGGKLVVVSTEQSLDPLAFREVLIGNGVTVLNQTPTAFHNLIQNESSHHPDLVKLRYVIFGGEKLNPKILRDWITLYPDVKLINMYGITETTIHVTYHQIREKEIHAARSVIGKPLPAVSAYILDENLKIVPQGFLGELYVGGSGVSKGYMNDPQLTQLKFIENPFQPGEILYKSGDLVRLDDEQELEYIGRKDQQIQLKGFRIELGEIEAALTNYRYIDDAKVMVVERNGQQQLVAYYMAAKPIASTHLRRVLSASLPVYMIPSCFQHLDKIPLTVNGKINYALLPEPAWENTENHQDPETPTENSMVSIWMETLGLSQIGREDNFFSIGGDSMMAIRLIALTNKTFNASLKIVDLYNCQTVREFSARVDQSDQVVVTSEYDEIEQQLEQFHAAYVEGHPYSTIEKVYPMSNIERGMCFIQQKSKDHLLYYEQLVWSVPYRDFNYRRFVKAVELIVELQTALRTGLDVRQNAHIIYKQIELTIPYKDIQDLKRTAQEDVINADMKQSRSRRFNLQDSPLWNMSLYRLAEHNHAILFEIHHAISDGWSIASFLTELNTTYVALETDPSYRPASLRSGYREFIREEMLYERNDQNLEFWREELADFKKFDFHITAQEKRHTSTRIPLGEKLYKRLEALALERNTTIKNICFAAYVYALRMFGYEDDIVVGMVTFNRLIGEDGARVFGNFLNTIPVRIQLNRNLTGSELLDLVQQKLVQVKAYDRSSLFSINRALGATTFAENPITDTLFNFTKFHVSYELSLERGSSQGYEKLGIKDFVQGHGLFEVNVNGVENDFFVQYECVSSFIDEPTFHKYHLFFLSLLGTLADTNDQDVSLLTRIHDEPLEAHKIFNDTHAIYPQDVTVVDLVEQQMAQIPHEVALIYEGNQLTYGELASRTNRLARYLQTLGVGAGSIVPICVERSFEMVIGIIAILKAGAAYVPIDPTYPVQRIAFILEDTGSNLLLIHSANENRWHFPALTTVLLDNQNTCHHLPDHSLKLSIGAQQVAYVIYTSGTTGQPKGVMNHHAGLYNRLIWMRDYFQIDPSDVILQKTTFCFDVSVWELLLSLITGGRMVLAGVGRQADSRYLQDLIFQHKITTVHFVPSMLAVFLRDVNTDQCASLTRVICSGEALERPLVNEYRSVLSHCELYNLYGPTEAAIDVTAAKVDIHGKGPVSMGAPIANTYLYVADEHGNLMPLGGVGELLIGGIQVAKGYLNQKTLTHERFVVDRFAETTGQRLYKTGDLVRWLPDGTLQYFGRIDSQVKLRGYRIELGEVERQLNAVPGVLQATALIKGTADSPYLVGYYVSQTPLDSHYLQVELQQRIPLYMVPSYFIYLQEMPLTHNGKINRRELPDVVFENVAEEEGAVNDFEKKMIAIWAEVLQLAPEKIGVQNSFFELGGHSLNATILINAVDKEFNIEFPLEDIFMRPTVRLMAEYVESRCWLKDQQDDAGTESTALIV